jgi:hypothetical protein
MKNQSRLNLIAEICAKRNAGPKLVAVVMPTRADTREEIALNVSQDDKAQGQSLPATGDDDIPALPSALFFDSVTHERKGEGAYVLTPEERKQAKADLLAYRIRQDLSRPRNPYALALIPA